MSCKGWGSILSILFWMATVVPANAGKEWRTRAFLDVTTTGVIEVVVPPELISRQDRQALDIALTGPDGRPRAFELYWREPVGRMRMNLQPSRVLLDPAEGFIWETTLPEKIVARRLTVSLSRQDAIGKIDVLGLTDGQWISLARDAAVFTTDGVRQAAIDIPPGTYSALRLDLTGYNRSARQTLTPIEAVTLEGDRPGKDFAAQTLALPFRQTESEGRHLFESVLPGDGLWISRLHLTTEAQFLGEWQVGRERISDGRRVFESAVSGRIAHVDQSPGDLKPDIDQIWLGRSLVLRLDAGDRYIGTAKAMTVTVRLPRLVFSADQTGRYTVMTGTGKHASIRDYPGVSRRETFGAVQFSAPQTNPAWRLATLLEKYQLKGGPFSPAGYTWRAPVSIPDPGYYRLALNLEAGLTPRRSAVRMVFDDTQVPYVAGRLEDRVLDLEAAAEYDAQKNLSTWTIRLPQASPYWKDLTVYANGIFKRTVEFQKPKPGTRGWQPWRQAVWESRGQQESALRLSLRNLPEGTDTVRLVMAHGDNQPVRLARITAGYTTPTIYFLAHKAGAYTIYGGNAEAAAPRYDLSLVQAELFSTLPAEAQMGRLELFQPPGWQNRLKDAFKESGWGLYAVLGLVTLVLLIVILRLFPKPGERSPS